MAPSTHITVVPASAKTITAAIKALLASPSPPHVRGIYRDLAKVPEAFASNPNFTAVNGTVEDASSLDLGEKCDAVITITPPLYGPPPEDGTVGFTRRVSENLKKAVQAKRVGRVVLLSSWGAQFSEGTGEILTNHAEEVVLADAAPEVIYARATAFMENWAMEMGNLQADKPFISSMITPVDFMSPTIAVADIGRGLAALASSPEPSSPSPRAVLLEGPTEYSPLDAQKAFETVLGKAVELKAVESDHLVGFLTGVAHFQPEMAKALADMSRAMMPGGKIFEAWKSENGKAEVFRGTTTLEEAIKGFFQ